MTFVDALFLGVAITLATYCAAYFMLLRHAPDPAMAIELLFLPYWTLVGAVPVLLAKRERPLQDYSYLEERLFPIFVDNNYARSILAYVVFLAGTLSIIALACRREDAVNRAGLHRVWIGHARRFSHIVLLGTVGVLLVAKLSVVAYLVARNGGESLYLATRIVRGGQAQIIRAYQYLNFIVSYPLAAAFAIWLSFPKSRLKYRPLTVRLIWATYLLMLLVVLAENALLGNRAVPLVMMAAVTAGWFRWRYLSSERDARRPLRRRFFLVAAIGMLAVGTIGVSRGGSLDTPSEVVSSLGSNAMQVGNVILQSSRSSEKLAAHMSLYGVMTHDSAVGLDLFGSDSYGQYTAAVGAPSDQVFTLHYVAAWWLRLGPFGLIPALFTLALAVAGMQRIATRTCSVRTAGFSLAAATLPAAGIPIIVLRSGPESLRGVALELLLVPGLTLLPAFLLGRAERQGTG